MTTVIKNRRTFLSPGKRGKRRGLRAETKLVWALPCKKEEDESQRAGGAAIVIKHDGSIISRDVISDVHTTEFRMMPFFGQNEQSYHYF